MYTKAFLIEGFIIALSLFSIAPNSILNNDDSQIITIVQGDEYRFNDKDYISFNSSRKKIASINSSGVVKALNTGQSYLTLTDKQKRSRRIKVEVLPRTESKMRGEFPILAWYSLQDDLSHSRFVELSDAGFNLSFSYATDSIVPQMERAVKAVEGTGVRLVIPFRGTWVDVGPIVDKFKDSDALWGWYILDEPSRNQMQMVKEFIDKIKAFDDEHPFYVNLLPTYAPASSLGGSYEEYILSYVDIINPSFISFDHYPVTSKGIRKDFYRNLDIVSTYSKKYSIPFWAFGCSVKYTSSVPTPRLEHLKYEVFSALAFGAQGIQYFTYTTPRTVHGGDHFWNAPLDKLFNQTPTYSMVKEVNTRIRSLEDFFLGADLITVGYIGTGDIDGIRRFDSANLPKSVKTIRSSGKVILSRLENENKELFVIVNADFDKQKTVWMDIKDGIKKISKDGQPVSVSPIEILPPGEMLVYII